MLSLRHVRKAIFSTTFFYFHAENSNAIISPWFWVYWIITVPVTLIVLGLWYIWHRHIKNIKMKKTEEMEEMECSEVRRERMLPLWAELNGL
jgi:flagellar biosynthesis/type III secretory pathway M-ring protein FliF/YscJ